jgi:hypothetical protein
MPQTRRVTAARAIGRRVRSPSISRSRGPSRRGASTRTVCGEASRRGRGRPARGGRTGKTRGCCPSLRCVSREATRVPDPAPDTPSDRPARAPEAVRWSAGKHTAPRNDRVRFLRALQNCERRRGQSAARVPHRVRDAGASAQEEWIAGHVSNFREAEGKGTFARIESVMRNGLKLSAYGSAFETGCRQRFSGLQGADTGDSLPCTRRWIAPLSTNDSS